MKIIVDDDFMRENLYIIIGCIEIVMYKIKQRKLNNDDYDMILSHLEFYKDLLEEAKNNGKNN